jgi:organic radical activating enzyme
MRNSNKLALFSLTDECNLKCSYCIAGCNKHQDYKKSDSKLYLSMNNFIDNIIYNGTIILTGGEPSLHPEFHQFIDLALECGNRVVVYTNLTNPDKFARYFDNENVYYVGGVHPKYRNIDKFKKMADQYPHDRLLLNLVVNSDAPELGKTYIDGYNHIITGDDKEISGKLTSALPIGDLEHFVNSNFITPDGLVFNGICDKSVKRVSVDATDDCMARFNELREVSDARMTSIYQDKCYKKCQTVRLNNYIINTFIKN